MITLLTGISAILIFFIALHWNALQKVRQLRDVKKQEVREERQRWSRMANRFKWAWIASLLAVIITSVMSLQGTKSVMLTHIHGLGYSGDGQQIIIPSHYGLKFYSEGTWSAGKGDKHDYMGFTSVDNGFYSSGHPEQGSNKKNPFGLVKSTDDGLSLDFLDLYGEIDFHLMSASYNTHTVYVFNPEPNSQMNTAGLYYTKDEATTWLKSEMAGLNEAPTALAVHPTNDSVIAVGTKDALYISNDSGNQFEKIADLLVTSLSISSEGALFVGSFNGKSAVHRVNIEKKEWKEISLPDLGEDTISYIALNPVDMSELVFSTFKMNVYISKNQGMNWKEIVIQGNGV